MTAIDYTVEIAFNAGYDTAAASRTWTDVTDYVDLGTMTITHGRQDERSVADANRLTLTLNNTDGRFTLGYASGAYYPNVKVGRPIRVTATPSGQSASTRFLGYVEKWPVEWPGGSESYATATITAASRMSRLGRNELPTLPTLELPNLSYADYYPLFVNYDGLSMTGSGRRVTFSAPPSEAEVTDGLDMAFFEPNDNGNGRRLWVSKSGHVSVAASFVLGSGDDGALLGRYDSNPLVLVSPFGNLDYQISASVHVTDGKVELQTRRAEVWASTPANDEEVEALVTGPRVDDGLLHTFAITPNASDSDDLDFYVDGELVGTATNSVLPTATIGTITTGYRIGSARRAYGGDLDTFNGHIGRVAADTSAWDSDDVALYDNIFRSGFDGETPGDRLERYAGYGDVLEFSFDTGITPISNIALEGRPVLDVMRDVETTDGGVLYDAPDGTLTYAARNARANAASSLTFDVESQEVEPGFSPVADRSVLVNKARVTTVAGDESTYSDSTSISAYGEHTKTETLATTADYEAAGAASFWVNAYAEPEPRAPNLAVDIGPDSAARQAAVLALAIGDRTTVDNLPAQAAASSSDFFVEGYTETIGVGTYVITFNVSPTSPHDDIFALDDGGSNSDTAQLDAGFRLAR